MHSRIPPDIFSDPLSEGKIQWVAPHLRDLQRANDNIKSMNERIKRETGTMSDTSIVLDLESTPMRDPAAPGNPENMRIRGPIYLRYLNTRKPRIEINMDIMKRIPRTISRTYEPMPE
jgi:hypothetical protein